MKNLKEKWIEFRCYHMSEVHKELKDAFIKKAPDKKYFLFDYYGVALNIDNFLKHLQYLTLIENGFLQIVNICQI